MISWCCLFPCLNARFYSKVWTILAAFPWRDHRETSAKCTGHHALLLVLFCVYCKVSEHWCRSWFSLRWCIYFFVLGIRRVCCLYTANFLWLITLHCIIMITNLRIILRPLSDIPAILSLLFAVCCRYHHSSSFTGFFWCRVSSHVIIAVNSCISLWVTTYHVVVCRGREIVSWRSFVRA